MRDTYPLQNALRFTSLRSPQMAAMKPREANNLSAALHAAVSLVKK